MNKVGATLIIAFVILLALQGPLYARKVELWIDTSGSVDWDMGRSAPATLANIITKNKGTERVEVFGFAGGLDALRLPVSVIDLPKRRPASSCKAESEFSILTTVAEADEKECARTVQRADAEREREIGPLSHRLEEQIEVLTRRPPSKSTCLFSVLLRCVSEGPGNVCVVLTDGENYKCPVPPRPSPMSNSLVVVLLVPEKGDDENALKRLEERATAIRAYASRIVVVPLFKMERELTGLIAK